MLCPGQQDTSNAEGDAESTGTDRGDENKLKATLIGDILTSSITVYQDDEIPVKSLAGFLWIVCSNT